MWLQKWYCDFYEMGYNIVKRGLALVDDSKYELFACE